MKDMGDAEWILGMKVTRDRRKRTITLSQASYIDQILSDFHMDTCKPMETPAEVGTVLSHLDDSRSEEERRSMSATPYLELIGSLLYASICIRPDISHAVGVLSRFMKQPGVKHWKAAKRILRYLKGSKQHGIVLGDRRQNMASQHQSPMSSSSASSLSSPSNACLTSKPILSTPCPIDVYCDANWANDLDGRRSTSGCVVFIIW